MDPYSEDHGLVFRSFVYLFKVLQEHENCNFVLKASFLEIYNEKVLFLSLSIILITIRLRYHLIETIKLYSKKYDFSYFMK